MIHHSISPWGYGHFLIHISVGIWTLPHSHSTEYAISLTSISVDAPFMFHKLTNTYV